MIQSIQTPVPAAARAVRLTQAEAQRGPSIDENAAQVQLEGKTSENVAYAREAARTSAGGAEGDLRAVVATLPRGVDGRPAPERLVAPNDPTRIGEVLDRIAREGLQEPGAIATFIHAVDRLFGEYGRDLGLSPEQVDQARQSLAGEVGQGAKLPQGGLRGLSDAIEEFQARIIARRQDVMTAAGDLSKVLSELVVSAQETPEDPVALGRLGEFVAGLQQAVAQRSTRDLRAAARERVVQPPAVTASASADAIDLGRRFLRQLNPA